MATEPRVRALLSVVLKGDLPNPYTQLFINSLPEPVEVVGFSWPRALFTRYDIFHVHWPETLVRDSNLLKRILKRVLLVLLLLRCRLLSVPIIRTVHNEAPHDSGGWIEGRLLTSIDRHTAYWIVMNCETISPADRPRRQIRHGHYRSWYDIPRDVHVKPNSLLFFGEIRSYKNVLGLCQAFLSIAEDESCELVVMGRPGDDAIEQDLRALVADADRVTLRLEYVPSTELISAIAEAHIIVLPYARFHNSGAALLALSVGRPIVVPDCAAARELLDEFGHDHVKIFSGELDSNDLRQALVSTQIDNLPEPDMTLRDWPTLGNQVVDVYRQALSARR